MKFNNIPKWQRELDNFKDIKSTFIFEGDTRDIYPLFTGDNDSYKAINFINLNAYIDNFFNGESNIYDIIYYDTVNGFHNPFNTDHVKKVLSKNAVRQNDFTEKTKGTGKVFECDLLPASEIVKNALLSNQQNIEMSNRKPVVFVLNYASRYTLSPNSLDSMERKVFMNLYYASLHTNEVVVEMGVRKRNMLFVIVDKVNDLPPWFYLENPNIKTLSISTPNRFIREEYINIIFKELLSSDEKIKKERKKFVEATDGLKCDEIRKIKALAIKSKLPLSKLNDAVFLYKYGIKTDPWASLDMDELKNANKSISERVKGQNVAISKTLDVIKRSASGLSGIQHNASKSRPKGVLFFAGPTGVGKTELAKTIAEVLFGDESNCIRFDMSEYQQSHSDQKLLGAPPGYVGYEAGGQLTNAVKEKPFSILLFDEIEKAHPSILDKFLQILDDGRMTDGQGNTVYFSETIIIFTSNLGIYRSEVINGEEKKVQIVFKDDKYEDVKDKVIKEVKDYFNLKLGRPEILNRIGNNIIVFDFIRPNVTKLIVDKQLNNIKKNLKDTKKIDIITDDIRDFLVETANKNLENGGRGIGNIVEEYFLNPLSRYCFDYQIGENAAIYVQRINVKNGLITLECEVA